MHLSFLMMAMNRMPHADIWLDFLIGAPPGSWAFYLHCKNATSCAEGLEESGLRGVVTLVPSVYSAWCEDLVSPMLQLLKYALRPQAKDFRDVRSKFIFLSAEHLPIKPFRVMRYVLGRHPDATDFCAYPSKQWVTAREDNTTLQITGSQWIILSRMDAETLSKALPEPRESENISVSPVEGLRPSDFKGWFCIDEMVPFSQIFGLFHADRGANESTFKLGIGNVTYPADYEQGCCRSWVWVQAAMPSPERYIESRAWASGTADILLRLLSVQDSSVRGPATHVDPDGGGGEIVYVIEKLGPQGVRILRNSPFLFARKFDHNASLPGYAATMFS